MSQKEAVSCVQLLIDSKPNSWDYQRDYFFITIEIGQHLADYARFLGKEILVFSGDEFLWKRVKMKVL